MGASPAPALAKLKRQLNHSYPIMMMSLLWIMADARHVKAGTSDHIGGNAIDFPKVLTAKEMLGLILRLLRDPRTHYIIHNGWFYHPGKAPAVYHGSDPHKGHAHLSIIVAKREDGTDWEIMESATYDSAYYWIDAEIPAIRKADLVTWCKLQGLKLIVRAGNGTTLVSIHVGELKKHGVLTKLEQAHAGSVIARKSSGRGHVAPDGSVRRLNIPTTTTL